MSAMLEMPPDAFQLTLELVPHQQAATAAMVEAYRLRSTGDLAGALEAHGREIDHLKQAIRIVDQLRGLGPTPLEAGPFVQTLRNSLFISADLEWSLGNRERSDALRSEAMDLATQRQSEPDRMRALRENAAGLAFAGRFNHALGDYTTALDYFLDNHHAVDAMRTAIDQAGLLEWLGDLERALLTLERAQKIAEAAKLQVEQEADPLKAIEGKAVLHESETQLLNAFGLVHRSREDYASALPYFEQVVERQKNEPSGPAAEFQVALCTIRSGNAREGLSILQRIEPLFRQHGMLRPKLGVLLKLQAEARRALGDADSALTLLDEGVRELERYADLDSQWRLDAERGAVLSALGRDGEAMEAWMHAAKIVNQLHASPMGYRLDSTYLRSKIPFFETAIAKAAEVCDANAALRLIEMVKARSLAATLSQHGHAGEADTELTARFAELSQRIDALEYQSFAGREATDSLKERRTLLQERTEVLERLHQADARWRNLTAAPELDIEALNRQLDQRHQAFIDLFLSRDNVLTAVVIVGGEVRVATSGLDGDTASALDDYDSNLRKTVAAGMDALMFDMSLELGVNADDLIPASVLDAAMQANSILLAPHGKLHLLPWASMLYKDVRLFETHPIGIVPNASAAMLLDGTSQSRPRLAVFGVPDYADLPALDALEAPDAAATDVFNDFSQRGRTLGVVQKLGDATQDAFGRLLATPETNGNILIAVCHGVADAADPLNSALLLTGGKVDVAEISRARVHFAEVILAACSAGWRPQMAHGIELVGDDIISLPGAFLEAGARSLIVSIPPADADVAAQFLREYFRHREGSTPLVAMQRTQQAMAQKTDIPPALWVGFTMYGTT